jgi:hypothetical protein
MTTSDDFDIFKHFISSLKLLTSYTPEYINDEDPIKTIREIWELNECSKIDSSKIDSSKKRDRDSDTDPSLEDQPKEKKPEGGGLSYYKKYIKYKKKYINLKNKKLNKKFSQLKI